MIQLLLLHNDKNCEGNYEKVKENTARKEVPSWQNLIIKNITCANTPYSCGTE
jgi:hypothetical protein